MKKIILVAALATITACNQAETVAEPVESEEAAPAEVMAADGGPAHGNFKVTLADGTVIMDEVRADGTYTATMPDGTTESGTWVQKPGEYCSTPDTEGATERCSAESIDENGVWIAVSSDGETVTVERVVEEAAAE